MAKRLDIRTTNRCENLVAAPAVDKGQQRITISSRWQLNIVKQMAARSPLFNDELLLTIHICCIIARVNVCHGDQEPWPDELRILE